uniref:NADH dehydrogenase subunit 4L n=1 Tax=Dipylidium caninum TaxID=66787 RepID=A0A7H9SS03_DIPCN|nr:NADH dehydrogenase subunit 4L [Dipylidium caninum]
MVSLFLLLFSIICFSYFLSFNRFLSSLIILENFNVVLLLFCLLSVIYDNHMLFIILMVVSTVEVVVGLVVLTRVWECSIGLELVSF